MQDNRKDWASFFEQIEEMYSMDAKDFDARPDMVNSPKHYILSDTLQVKDVREALLQKITREGLVIPHEDVYDWITAWEYITRSPFKNKREDIEKAIWYLNSLLERMDKRSSYVYPDEAE
jgi:hypothetical protein